MRRAVFNQKGGVGKSTLSLAFTKHLQDQGKKVEFIHFGTTAIGQKVNSKSKTLEIAKNLGIKTQNLILEKSCEEYMAQKLKSKSIAGWIIKTSFSS